MTASQTPDPTPTPAPASAPVAKKVPFERTHHGHTFVDQYEWLRDKESPEVIAHIEAENAWTKSQTADLEGLREAIFTEIKTRVKETDMSVPSRRGQYWYFTRTKAGLDYGIHVRIPIRDADDWTPPEIGEDALLGEEIVFDSNVEADGTEFFSLGTFSLSDDGRYLLYGVDNAGDERYTLRIRDLATSETLPDTIDGTFAGAFLDPTGAYVFYTTVDDAWRPEKVWRHRVGAVSTGAVPTDADGAADSATDTASSNADVCIFHEPDEHFFVGAGMTRSGRYVFIVTGSKTTSGYWSLPVDDLEAEPREVWPRVDGVEYSVEHAVVAGEDRFLITHNRDRADFDLIDVPAADPASAGRAVLADVDGMRLEDVDAFETFVALSYRRGGFARVGIIRLDADAAATVTSASERDATAASAPESSGSTSPFGPLEELPFGRETGTLGLSGNPEFAQTGVRLTFTSMSTPAVISHHSVADGTDTVLKRQPVLGSVDLSDYTETLEWATAVDGARIPISIVHRTDLDRSAPAPLMLYGYGSYEVSMDPYFSVARLSLLDRGVVFAIAHIRGGGEMGRHWYDEGKMLAKRNTFTDFIAAGRHLVDTGWTAPEMLAASGGSAGGLLMGAVANMAPDLFAGIAADVPFVDALTSILMPELPLTVIEWEEWGDPLHDPDVYEYMRSYSPYENVADGPHPKILAITSLNDTRVLYVEPAKWVARLREVGAEVLLKTEMVAGHGGASGRYDAWKETAFEFAWILDVVGRPDVNIEP